MSTSVVSRIPKPNRVSVKIPVDLKTALQEVARNEGRPFTWVLSQAIQHYILVSENDRDRTVTIDVPINVAASLEDIGIMNRSNRVSTIGYVKK